MLRRLNEHMLIIDILDDIQILILRVDLDNDCFDRGIALDEHA